MTQRSCRTQRLIRVCTVCLNYNVSVLFCFVCWLLQLWRCVSSLFIPHLFFRFLRKTRLSDCSLSCITSFIYSRLSLSRPRLSRITAYHEMKIWSLPKDENLITDNKILWKKGAISPLFHNIFNISLTSRVQLHIYLLNVVV